MTLDRQPSEGTDMVRDTGVERLGETLAAYEVVLSNVGAVRAIEAMAAVPDVLESDERLRALAFGTVAKIGTAVLVLTDRRLWIGNHRDVIDGFSLARTDWSVASAGRGLWAGNSATFERGDEQIKIKTFLPTAEMWRILVAFGARPPGTPYEALGDSPRDPGAPPIGGFWELALYEDRLIDQDWRHLPLRGEVTASVDTAGALAVTRGRNLAAKGAGTLVFGPLGLLFAGNAKHRQVDTRELYLLVEGPNWAYTRAFDPNAGAALRDFALQISTASKTRSDSLAAQPASPDTSPGVTSIAAELRELASLREEGILSDEEFTQQKRKLLDNL